MVVVVVAVVELVVSDDSGSIGEVNCGSSGGYISDNNGGCAVGGGISIGDNRFWLFLFLLLFTFACENVLETMLMVTVGIDKKRQKKQQYQ